MGPRLPQLLICLAVVAGGPVPHAQDAVAIPPIPPIEHFIPRGELKATLRLSADRLVPGEVPVFWLVLENAGGSTVRVPRFAELGENVTRDVSATSSGDVRTDNDCIRHPVRSPIAVRTLVKLAPRQSVVLRLDDPPCGRYILPPLPVGEYRIQAKYWNYPDSPLSYDIYEEGGAEAWDGEIEAPAVVLTVVPFGDVITRALIDVVERDAGATEAIRLLGLHRTRAAVDVLLQRFARDPATRADVIVALGYIGEPTAAARLSRAIEQFPLVEHLRQFSASEIERSLHALLEDSRDCEAVPLLVFIPMVDSARVVEERCRDLRRRLEAIRDTPLPGSIGSLEYRGQMQREINARRLLASLARPGAPVETADTESVAGEPKPQPEQALLPEYVAMMRSDRPGAFDLALAGVTRFGTPETFGQLRDALGQRPDASTVLAAFTFQDDDRPRDQTFWDRWWQQNRRRSREQWARDALARQEPHVDTFGKWWAAQYLITVQRGRPRLVRELATHRSSSVRLGAAEALIPFDPQYAGRLMLRELQNRHVNVCHTAGSLLSDLTGQWHPFRCSEVAGRERAWARWTHDVDLLPRGPLSTSR